MRCKMQKGRASDGRALFIWGRRLCRLKEPDADERCEYGYGGHCLVGQVFNGATAQQASFRAGAGCKGGGGRHHSVLTFLRRRRKGKNPQRSRRSSGNCFHAIVQTSWPALQKFPVADRGTKAVRSLRHLNLRLCCYGRRRSFPSRLIRCNRNGHCFPLWVSWPRLRYAKTGGAGSTIVLFALIICENRLKLWKNSVFGNGSRMRP